MSTKPTTTDGGSPEAEPLSDEELGNLRDGYWPIGMYGYGSPPAGMERLLATIDALRSDHRAVVEAVRRLHEAVAGEIGPGPYEAQELVAGWSAVRASCGTVVAEGLSLPESEALASVLNLPLPGGE